MHIFGQVLGALGGAIGDSYGGGPLTMMGRMAGRYIGESLDQDANDYEKQEYYYFRKQLGKYYFHSNAEGKVIPQIYGFAPCDGQMIWAKPIREEQVETQKESKANIKHEFSYNYYATFALAICQGEIIDIHRVWAAGELIDLSDYDFTLYKGSESQLPNQTIEEDKGIAPAFRGTAYIIFKNMPINKFGNKVPNFTFEVQRKPKLEPSQAKQMSLEDQITNMVMIPGSGEFVYDTEIQQKIIEEDSSEIYRSVINSNNKDRMANAIYSLNQLQDTCSNVQWVAPVVCWFGNSLEIGDCKIEPRIEYNDAEAKTSEDWHVGKYNKKNTKVISRDEYGNPNYGGTVNDKSLLRYLSELQRRKLKIMFYPMIFMDLPGKPWRGHISGNAAGIDGFFNNDMGYKNFILHYANLVKGKVDAFVIGSEMKGITKLSVGQRFLAVDELIDLAKQVKNILGKDVVVTYAADWSEYHHTEGGWHHLDPLWSSAHIDVVGIDAYFPISDNTNSYISKAQIKKGWQEGEGYNFYYQDGEKKSLSADYAWKNLEHWWQSEHYNPDSQKTSWQPKSKKIWFTELGFASIDKCSNQPNIFYDPKCSDGGVPKGSHAEVNFSLQKRALAATIEHFANSQIVEEIFFWTWDARPYPAWPHSNYWQDSYLWSKGHWYNNKLGGSSLAEIFCDLSGQLELKIDVESMSDFEEYIYGFKIENNGTIFGLLFLLAEIYDFVLAADQDGVVRFIKNDFAKVKIKESIDFSELVKINDSGFYERINKKAAPPSSLISYINAMNYQPARSFSQKRKGEIQKISLPLISTAEEIRELAELKSNKNSKYGDIYIFKLPLTYLNLLPADIIEITNFGHEKRHFLMQITCIKIKKSSLKIYAIEIKGDSL